MDTVSKTPYLPTGETVVEIAATGTTVTTYHPLRTVGTRLLAGVPVEWQLHKLYRGFGGSALAAHQLSVMSLVYRKLKAYCFPRQEEAPTHFQQVMMGAMAGLVTTPTVTPLDMHAVQRQLDQPYCWRLSYRGWAPTAMRQSGAGAGMLVGPALFESAAQKRFPAYASRHENQVKVACGLLAGCLTALLTQYFDMARLLMQADAAKLKYLTTRQTFKAVPELLFSRRGAGLTAVRLIVVVVATVMMDPSRHFFSRLFKGGQ